MTKRINKENYYLEIANTVAQRATCLRRKFGAVIVKNDRIISTGYCGAPRGSVNCCDIGKCRREELHISPGERYELCRSVHAEANAIISADGLDMIGATLYLCGIDTKTNKLIDSSPCLMCKRMIVNAGIKNVVCKSANTDEYVIIPVKNFLEEL